MSSNGDTKALSYYLEHRKTDDGYKETPMGRIPEEWSIVSIKNIVEKTEQIDPQKQPDKYFKYIDVSSVSNESLKVVSVNEFKGINAPSRARRIVRTDDIIFATIRPNLKRVAIICDDLEGQLCSTAFCVLRCMKNIAEPYFVFQTVTTDRFIGKLCDLQCGSGYPAVTDNDLLDQQILLPPISEQRKIAAILGTLDSLIEETDRVVARTGQLKKGLIQEFLTEGMGNVELEDTALGMIPKHWKCVPFATLSLTYKNGIYKHDKYYGSGYPCIRMYNIADGTVNTINSPLLNVTDAELKEYELAEGDLLINRVNSRDLVGKAGIVPAGLGHVTFESKNIRVRLNRSMILPEFMGLFIQSSMYRNQVNKFVKSAIAQSTINQDDLDNILVPLPPKDEQEKIASVIREINSKITWEIRYRERIELVKKALMQDLLTGRIRVKPDTIAPEATP
ncbi:restriction endonuclease subunit S [Methanocella arvoryzae]|uniref:Type I restriction modification system,specificity subunit n=1 Tax=Methanocella arvoryzae (strain DSM 22066 / NBRC 105507 / MRE50) TaxID=351160 RepID=Q0W5N3_METAR|nr:restriction endonuclease subunit S [Methanocella arvoryzae]CAJ36310.1 type I restriction modification system,specificity subunit [Methanocella arvoryzae MRE50]